MYGDKQEEFELWTSESEILLQPSYFSVTEAFNIFPLYGARPSSLPLCFFALPARIILTLGFRFFLSTCFLLAVLILFTVAVVRFAVIHLLRKTSTKSHSWRLSNFTNFKELSSSYLPRLTENVLLIFHNFDPLSILLSCSCTFLKASSENLVSHP